MKQQHQEIKARLEYEKEVAERASAVSKPVTSCETEARDRGMRINNDRETISKVWENHFTKIDKVSSDIKGLKTFAEAMSKQYLIDSEEAASRDRRALIKEHNKH